jgi:hypothetical protein
MSPLADDELRRRIEASDQARRYAADVDRESAREILAGRAAAAAPSFDVRVPDAPVARAPRAPAPRAPAPRAGRQPPSTFESILRSPVTRTVAGTITRTLMGALLGTSRRRRY